MFDKCYLKAQIVLNCDPLTFKTVTVLNQMVTTTRQSNFEILRDNNVKIGMNTTSNKFYCLSGKVNLLFLNLSYVHFKKVMKVQF